MKILHIFKIMARNFDKLLNSDDKKLLLRVNSNFANIKMVFNNIEDHFNIKNFCNSVNMLKYAIQNDYKLKTKTSYFVNSIDVFVFLKNQNIDFDDETFYCAIKSTNIDVIQWLYDNNCEGERDEAYITAQDTHNLHVLRWMKRNNYDFNNDEFTRTAKKGNLNKMKILLLEGFDWNEDTFKAAIRYGNLENIKWLYENGCPWNNETYAESLLLHDTEITKWLEENNCPK